MKRRFWSLMVVLALALSLFGTAVYAADGDVEVKFCVGDDTLMINGEAVTVVTPYVVGEGVTLVPVRVITEAFGATVEWVDETQTVLLTYPDVNISLQIGNPVAEVNGRAETLLSAPELTNDSTMVPLRFISENFGAEVSYEPKTEAITVTKKANSSGNTTVEGITDKRFIGDSYYGWSMENPTDMQMHTRYFDGTLTSFIYNNENGIKITIQAKSDDYDFDGDFKAGKDALKDLTLVKADKDTTNPNKKTMHLQAKDKTIFFDFYRIITDKYIYYLDGLFETEQTEWIADATHILSTFDISFTTTDTYDLSNVKNGFRRFEADNLKLSFDVPQEYIMTSDEDAETSFSFENISLKDSYSQINCTVYSKESVESAEALANYDFERNRQALNENTIVSFDTEVSQKTYAEIDTYTYAYEFKLNNANVYNRDTFFEIGDYVYNIAVYVKKEPKTTDTLVDKIMNSIKAEKLDPDEVGNILYNRETPEGTFVADDLAKCTMEIPNSFTELSASANTAVYASPSCNFLCNALTDQEYTSTMLTAIVKSLQTSQKNTNPSTIIQPSQRVVLGKNNFTKYCYKSTIDDVVTYGEVFGITKNGIAYIFSVEYSELSYSEYARNEINTILSSLTFK